MKLTSGHLTFCTNIYAGENWMAHFAVLKASFPVLKAQLSPNAPMGIGLRLSNLASIELLEDHHLESFKQWLEQEGGYVFTMNGFPYGGFHHTRVKDQVHAPDWTTEDRVEYTLRLAKILSQLLPDDMDGGISTSPLSYKPWFTNAEARKNATARATANMMKVAEGLNHIQRQSGKVIHLDIEPEPDGFLESGAEFIDWYENVLLPVGNDENLIKNHIRLCYDVCHFAIGYEPHTAIINELQEKGIKIGKIQISAALKAKLPASVSERAAVLDQLGRFDEPTYLHQVIARKDDGSLLRYPDLEDAMAEGENLAVQEWRAHFHVPIFVEDMGLIQSTQSDIIEVLNLQKNSPFTTHLEVETYTWEVLPTALKAPLNDSIIRELAWVKTLLEQ
ncbi:metabolite traffic protein EboE [Pedobacter riviphilus]|uniref:Metabolite traffic protein EboE n=1 Tax=Pedobacter riviphilus TaxID=2766984 RepID=A0ABX6TLN1_9SPHI|nr:metabolite traffic protein EboE [Pedobacter riviphilus]QNR85810.1 metabolite traffic protein EboE [Pedobacter riviphilus]